MRKVLFIIDKIEFKYFEFNDLVTNFWLIKEFLDAGDKVFISTIDKLLVQDSQAFALCFNCFVKDGNIFYEKTHSKKLIENFDMVMFRPDPPVDENYIFATHVFDFVDELKVALINNPCSIRSFNEKFHINYFPEFVPKNIITADTLVIKEFLKVCSKAVIKPLNRCFGSGVFILDKNDMNLNTIIKTATNDGNTPVMVQEFLESAKFGDKRVLTLGDDVLEECIIKAPLANDFKFSQHSDNYLKKAVLTDYEREFCTIVAQKLNSMGICMAGLDLLEEKIIEINITSPCYFIREINNLYGIKFEKKIMNYLQSKFLSKVV